MPSSINSVVHGGRAKKTGLVLQRLGRRYARIYADVLRYRRELQDDLTRSGRRLSVAERGQVQTAARLEMSARILERQCASQADMPPAEVRQHRLQIATWSAWRDRIVTQLYARSSTSGAPDWSAIAPSEST